MMITTVLLRVDVERTLIYGACAKVSAFAGLVCHRPKPTPNIYGPLVQSRASLWHSYLQALGCVSSILGQSGSREVRR